MEKVCREMASKIDTISEKSQSIQKEIKTLTKRGRSIPSEATRIQTRVGQLSNRYKDLVDQLDAIKKALPEECFKLVPDLQQRLEGAKENLERTGEKGEQLKDRADQQAQQNQFGGGNGSGNGGGSSGSPSSSSSAKPEPVPLPKFELKTPPLVIPPQPQTPQIVIPPSNRDSKLNFDPNSLIRDQALFSRPISDPQGRLLKKAKEPQ